MANVRVLAGDFTPGNHSVAWGLFSLVSERGRETIPIDRLIRVEVASEQNVKRFVRSAGLGLVGAVALGPLGMLAGILSGGNRKLTTFVATFADGRQLLAEADGAIFAKLHAATFRTNIQQRRVSHLADPEPDHIRRLSPPSDTGARSVWRRFEPELSGHLDFSERGQIDEMILRNEAALLDSYCTKLIRDQCGDAAEAILSRCRDT